MYYAFLFKSAEEWLQNLKRLKIAFCDVVEVIFLFEENHATTGVFNSLIELELYGLRNLKHIWYQVPSEIMAFQNLQLLILSKCHNLYLCSSRVAKLLVQLQKVYISCCEKMEEIIAKEDEKEIKGTILFPRLKLLELQHMPELKIFYSGTYVIEFPLLESLRFNQCSKMKYFSNGWLRTPMLERIHINGSTYSLMRNVNATMEHYMDNCVGTPSNDANPRFTMRISYHPRAGPSKLTYNSTTTNLDDSAPTNSAWTSQISAAAGRILVAPDYVKNFTFSDLKIATRNFIPDLCLGEGCFGKVFKGWLDEKTFAPSKSRSTGMVVAIKRLEKPRVIGYRECQSELNFLGRVSHPNLVKLFGYCWEDKELLLVYEFMPRGSLENHLFRRNPGIEPLSWDLRLKIAIGAARGLAFLHTSEKKDIFRDFKASNILLDSNYNAKISDFGLAKLGPSGGDSHVTTRVLGAYGYAAPEYIATGHLYVKSDVYGFGVVLLELMTGLRALDTKRPNRQQNLADWLRPILSNKIKLKNTMDLRIEGQYSSKAMMLAAQLSSKCIESEPKSRPSMEEVLEALEQIDAVKEKPKGNKSSGFFNPKFSL